MRVTERGRFECAECRLLYVAKVDALECELNHLKEAVRLLQTGKALCESKDEARPNP